MLSLINKAQRGCIYTADGMNGLTVCADESIKEARPCSPQTPLNASVYLFTPTLAHVESSGTRCALAFLALDGQISGEMKECDLDTTYELSAVGSQSAGCIFILSF